MSDIPKQAQSTGISPMAHSSKIAMDITTVHAQARSSTATACIHTGRKASCIA